MSSTYSLRKVSCYQGVKIKFREVRGVIKNITLVTMYPNKLTSNFNSLGKINNYNLGKTFGSLHNVK